MHARTKGCAQALTRDFNKHTRMIALRVIASRARIATVVCAGLEHVP